MATTFLGKPVPTKTPAHKPKRKKARHRWEVLLVLPVVFCGGLLALQKTTLDSSVAERSTGAALSRALNQQPENSASPTNTLESITLAQQQPQTGSGGTGTNGTTTQSGTKATTPATTTQVDGTTYCSPAKVKPVFFDANNNLISIFPIIPNGVRGLDSSGNLSPTVCSPAYWGRDVLYFFVYKGLAVLNWFAEALAIILTLYAGILYMTGFYNEGNVKTAKTMLIGVYTGLAIVLLAKTIVYSGINLAVKNDPSTVIKSSAPIPGLDSSSGTSGSGTTTGTGTGGK